MKYQLRRDYGGHRAGDVVEMSDKRARRLKPYIAAVVAEEKGTDFGVSSSTTTVVEDEQTPRPATNANKATWIDYAVSKGWTRDDAEAMTKADLVAEFAED